MKTLITLVGTKFCGPDIIKLVASFQAGEPMTLIRDPNNEHDRNAIKIMARGEHVGFVKGSEAVELARIMDAHRKAPDGADATLFGHLSFDGDRWPKIEINV
jgi:hypothetical protein